MRWQRKSSGPVVDRILRVKLLILNSKKLDPDFSFDLASTGKSALSRVVGGKIAFATQVIRSDNDYGYSATFASKIARRDLIAFSS